MAWSLVSLGHEATVSENWFERNAINIVFGAELLAQNQPEALPAGTILFNLEQPSHPNLGKVEAIAQNCKLTVWDYSMTNVKRWHELGVNIRHVPIGYTPNLTRIPQVKQDIDVLFLGWMTPRREKVLADLRAAGLKVVSSSNCYGGSRDNLLARAKICLNIHHDGRNLFEIVRVSYYLANGKCVVSERSADDIEYSDLGTGIWHVENEDFVSACKELIESEEKRESCGRIGAILIKNRDFTGTVSKALSETTPSEKVAARFALGSPDIGHYMPWLRDHAKGTILEIGVRDGASTSAFLSGVERNGGVVLSVDIRDCGDLFKDHPQWKFIQSDSQNLKLRVPEIDILFIDGDHTRLGYRADLDRYFPMVKPGGLIISHDIDPIEGQTLEDVPDSDYPSRAVREEYFSFCEKHSLEHLEIPGKYGLGVMRKPELVESDESWEASAAIL